MLYKTLNKPPREKNSEQTSRIAQLTQLTRQCIAGLEKLVLATSFCVPLALPALPALPVQWWSTTLAKPARPVVHEQMTLVAAEGHSKTLSTG